MTTEPREITNPFPGLRPFETDEYRLFFGREGQSDELITRLGRARFLAVVGTSGSGKSSLVRAGLLPALRGGMMAGAGAGWRVAVMRPGGDPVGNLAHALAGEGVLAEAGGGLPRAEAEAVIEATLRRGSLGLVDAVRKARLAGHEKLLVIADQFEELFRFRAARAASSTDDAAAFVKLLIEAARQREPDIYAVLTMRSDFLGDCSQFQGLPEAINEGQYLIPRMNRDERRAAVVGPVRVARARMSEPLVNRLLNDVGDNPDQLPILQHALMRTWEYWAAHRRDGEPVGLEHYEAIGTMAGALSEHADEAFDELPDGRSRHIAELLFKALTERGADNREIRRPTRLSEVCEIAGASVDEVAPVVEVFRREGRSFLMPPVGTALTPDTVLDISHESLIRNWERLKAWVSDEAQSARTYKRLAEAAALNRKGEEGLLQDPGLQLALDWREKSKPNAAWGLRYHPEFDAAIAYLDESRAANEAELAELGRREREEVERERREVEQTRAFAEQQARSARRLRWAAVAMAVLFVLSLGTAAYAYRLKQYAQDRAEEAQRSEAAALRAGRVADDERRHAVEERDSAKKATLTAERLKGELETKGDELQKNYDELKAERAEKERQAERANRQAADARRAEKAAIAERDRAEDAAKRGDFIREGLEKFQHNDPEHAAVTFGLLAENLEKTIPESTPQQAGDLKVLRGWALSHLGASQLQLAGLARDDDKAYAAGLAGAEKSYEESLRVLLEESRLSENQARADTLYHYIFEAYDGLGHTYHDIALANRPPGNKEAGGKGAGEYREGAEKIFKDALGIKKARLAQLERAKAAPREVSDLADEVAAGYLNLARLYDDTGAISTEERILKELRDFRKARGDADKAIAAQKELAEFYRDQGLPETAEAAYEELIDEQAKAVGEAGGDAAGGGPESGGRYAEFAAAYAERGPEIAESYYELAEVCRSQKGKQAKADDAVAAAAAVQRFAVRLRNLRSSSFGAAKPDDVNDLADAAADAYAKLGRPARALALYEYALDDRARAAKPGPGVWKSYERLTRFHRHDFEDFPKDFAKAERYNEELLKATPGDDETCARSPLDNDACKRRLAALTLFAELYENEPDRLGDARTYYDRAANIYRGRGDWMSQNVVLFKLLKMYARQKRMAEWKESARRRLDLLTGEMDKIVSGRGVPPRGYVTLVGEYANAVMSAADVYGRDGDDAAAAAAYAKAFKAYDFINGKIYNLRALKNYAEVLKKYGELLDRLGRQAEAAQVKDSAARVLKRVNESQDIQEQQSAQQTQQGATHPPAAQ
ncbi:MAG TPA: hypothetical protein VM936_02945 [Pyrinomonadaceae bacterium]|jgi:hypothetical protein|nr:hypothetical protein [Pyrinomonadaceae bacterium]